MGKDDLHLRKTNGDVVQQTRQSAFRRDLANKGCPGVEKHGQMMPGGVLRKVIQLRLIRLESGIHGKQFDPLKLQFLMSLMQFILPSWLRWIHGEEPHQFARMLAHIVHNILIWDPKSRQTSLATKYDRFVALSRLGVIIGPSNGEIDFLVSSAKKTVCENLW